MMRYTIRSSEVPMGFAPVPYELKEEESIGWDWPQMKVTFDHVDSRNPWARDSYEEAKFREMYNWVVNQCGVSYWDPQDDECRGTWVLQDFDTVVNFIFYHNSDALLFKLVFG